MKRLLIVLAVVTSFGLVGVTFASAADRHHGLGYGGHGRTHYVAPYSHAPRAHNFNYDYRHGYGYDRHHTPYRSGHHGNSHYGGPSYGHGSGYGHSGVRVTTPNFGLNIGH